MKNVMDENHQSIKIFYKVSAVCEVQFLMRSLFGPTCCFPELGAHCLWGVLFIPVSHSHSRVPDTAIMP